MLFHHRRTSFYPLVIALVTLALCIFMYATLSESDRKAAEEPVVPAVTESDYRAQSRAVIAPFLAAYQSAPTDIAKLVAVEDALADLMDLTVPVAYKDVHFTLAVSLTLMRDGLRGEEGSLENGFAKLTEVVRDYPWLAE